MYRLLTLVRIDPTPIRPRRESARTDLDLARSVTAAAGKIIPTARRIYPSTWQALLTVPRAAAGWRLRNATGPGPGSCTRDR